MTDREQVIAELQYMKRDVLEDSDKDITLNKAIALLKEQEPVEPEVYYVGTDKYKFYRCPVCKIDWHYKGNYCLGCGRAVKWND